MFAFRGVVKKFIVYFFVFAAALFVAGCADANAGSNQTVYSGDKVILDGSGSTPSDGYKIVKYSWKQLRGKRVDLKDKNSAKAYFIAPDVSKEDRLQFRLTVTEKSSSGRVIKSRDRVTITVKPKDANSDTTPPVITLLGDNPYRLEAGNNFSDPGATAKDDTDGTVAVHKSGEVNSKVVGEYTIYYTAKDKSGNEANATRVVKVVDTTPPTITLNGDKNISLFVGDSYTEEGATAIDNVDGDLNVTISGSVDTNKEGNYTISYSAVDKSGNRASKTRTITVATTNNSEIDKLKEVLKDPNVPYTTDADFNKTEYAKHHLSDDEAKKLERAHYLVATAKDPDPEWFATKADIPVYVAKPGENYTIQLKKVNKAGVAYAPVDNEKLRLVATIQRGKNNFQYITNVDIDDYAKWNGKGVLEIHVPNNLDKGRLLIGIRPNFNDVATTAIAERWSTVVSAEVWQTKSNVKELDETTVLFPVNTPSGFAAENKFSKTEIGQKVQQQMENDKQIVLPIIVKDITLKSGELISYRYKNKPYAGRVISVYNKQKQQLALMAPEYLNIYDIVDIDANSTRNNGLSPEHIIYREGSRVHSDTNESDPVVFANRAYRKTTYNSSSIFDIKCESGTVSITFEPSFDLYPKTNIGVKFSTYVGINKVKCSITPKPISIIYAPTFGTGGVAGIIMKIFGTEAKQSYYGGESITADGLPAAQGITTSWDLRKGSSFKFDSYGNDLGSLDISSSGKDGKGSIELSAELGIKYELDAISPDGYLGYIFSLFGKKDALKNVGVEAKVGPKISYILEALNAKSVYSTQDDSKFATKIGINASIGFSTTVENFFAYFGINFTKINASVNLLNYKGLLKYTYAKVNEPKAGLANIMGLRPSSRFIAYFLPKSLGVLSLKDSSVFNDKTDNITYDVSECEKNSDYKITSPAIACSGWFCGRVEKEIKLCKSKLSTSDIIAHARVEQLAKANATIVNNSNEDLMINIQGSPLEPTSDTLILNKNSSKQVSFEKICPKKPRVYRGVTKVSSEDNKYHTGGLNILVCHKDDTHGDPHIVTADGLGYDYYASGDYVLSRIKGVTGYEIQARFLPGYKTSWPQAVALRVGNDIVEIQGVKRDGHGDGSGVPINALAIWVNGKKGILGTDERYSSWHDEDSISKHIAKLPSGGIIAVTQTDSSNVLRFASNLTIIWPEGSPAKNYGVILSVAKSGDPFVHIQIARPDDFAGKEQGLMGNNDGNPKNDFIRRNGEVLGVDHNISFTELYALFGTDWLVRPYESLFRNPEAIKPEFPTDVVTLTPEQRALGEQACGALTGFYREACIIDVGLTGSAELVKEYYANTEDLNALSDAIVTPDVDQARYSMSVADKAYEADSGYYLHYTQNINITHEAGEGKFMLLVRPPRGATALLGTGDTSLTAEGNYTTHIEVDCTELNSATNQAYLQRVGSVQLWLQDPLSGTASKMISEEALPCTDASKRAGYSLKRGKRTELADSNDTNLHYTQPLSIVHTNNYTGEYILEITPPTGAVVKLNGSTTELNITGNTERNDTLELDCSMAESNATNGSIKLWEKDMLSGNKAYNYASYTLSCHKSKVLKTGQTTSYADFDDGYYQKGEERSYTRDDSKEIVTDNVTGLQWQDNSEAKTVTKPWITQANYNAGKYNDTSGDTAATYCANLTLGGYNDWRLPTRKELQSIVDYGRYTPALDPEFLNVASHYYWSSTTGAGSSLYACYVYFYRGYQYYGHKDDSYYVRCVRAGN